MITPFQNKALVHSVTADEKVCDNDQYISLLSVLTYNAFVFYAFSLYRYASELFPEGPKRIDWSDFLAAINGSHEQDEGSK